MEKTMEKVRQILDEKGVQYIVCVSEVVAETNEKEELATNTATSCDGGKGLLMLLGGVLDSTRNTIVKYMPLTEEKATDALVAYCEGFLRGNSFFQNKDVTEKELN